MCGTESRRSFSPQKSILREFEGAFAIEKYPQYKNMQFTKNIFMILNFANKNHRKGEKKIEIKI